jgi:excisionase family DNA binding protein
VSKQYLKVRDAAELLGLSEDTIRNWINRSRHKLPAVKAGRDWLIKREDLDHFLEDQKNVHGDEDK